MLLTAGVLDPNLEVGPNRSATGAPLGGPRASAWIGTIYLTSPGPDTCGDWPSSTGSGYVGYPDYSRVFAFNTTGAAASCGTPLHLYCAQQ